MFYNVSNHFTSKLKAEQLDNRVEISFIPISYTFDYGQFM
jgi:hypothetical protein